MPTLNCLSVHPFFQFFETKIVNDKIITMLPNILLKISYLYKKKLITLLVYKVSGV